MDSALSRQRLEAHLPRNVTGSQRYDESWDLAPHLVQLNCESTDMDLNCTASEISQILFLFLPLTANPSFPWEGSYPRMIS